MKSDHEVLIEHDSMLVAKYLPFATSIPNK